MKGQNTEDALFKAVSCFSFGLIVLGWLYILNSIDFTQIFVDKKRIFPLDDKFILKVRSRINFNIFLDYLFSPIDSRFFK